MKLSRELVDFSSDTKELHAEWYFNRNECVYCSIRDLFFAISPYTVEFTKGIWHDVYGMDLNTKKDFTKDIQQSWREIRKGYENVLHYNCLIECRVLGYYLTRVSEKIKQYNKLVEKGNKRDCSSRYLIEVSFKDRVYYFLVDDLLLIPKTRVKHFMSAMSSNKEDIWYRIETLRLQKEEREKGFCVTLTVPKEIIDVHDVFICDGRVNLRDCTDFLLDFYSSCPVGSVCDVSSNISAKIRCKYKKKRITTVAKVVEY